MSSPRMVLHQHEVGKIFNPSNHREAEPSPSSAIKDANSGKTTKKNPIVPLSLVGIEQLTETLVTIPHKSTDSWWQVYPLVAAMAILSAVLHMALFAVDLNSVNDGLEKNRRFIYGFLTWYQYLGLVPWVETCNYVLPKGEMPLRARILAVVVGMAVQKLFDAFIVESWWQPGAPAVFPIPFSSIVSCTISLPFSLCTLYCFVKSDEQSRRKFVQCIRAISTILLTIFVTGLWGVVFRHLQGSQWQKVFAVSFFLVRFFCKNRMMAPIAIRLNPRRWINLCLVVDLIVTRIQVSTFPYIDSIWVFLASTVPGFLFLLFRYYSGADRVGILIESFWESYVNGNNTQVDVLSNHVGSSRVADLTSGVLVASLSNLHSLGMKLCESASNHYKDWGDTTNSSTSGGSDDDDGVSETTIGGASSRPFTCSVSIEDDLELGLSTQSDEPQSEDATNKSCHSHRSTSSSSSFESICLDEEGYDDMFNQVSICIARAETVLMEAPTTPPRRQVSVSKVDVGLAEDASDNTVCESDQTVPEQRMDIESGLPANSNTDGDDAIEMDREGVHGNGDDITGCQPAHPLENREEAEPRDGEEGQEATEPECRDETEQNDKNCGRREAYQQSQANITNPKSFAQLQELRWEQRQLFHVVDLVGSEILATMTQIHHQIAIFIVRHLPIQKHLNASFNISLEQWKLANIYGWVFICFNIIVVASLTFFFRRIEKLERGRELRLNAVVAYIFRDNFWFIFHWMAAMGAIACVALINHFGADFTLHFDWLDCRTNMAWPLCAN